MQSHVESTYVNLSKGYLLALVVAFGALSLLLVLPFVQYVLAAVLIAYVLHPLQERLEPRTSPTVAALALVLLATAGFVIPFVLMLGVVVDSATQIVESLDAESVQLAELERLLEESTGMRVDLASELTSSGQEVGLVVLQQSPSAFTTITHTLIGLGLAIFLVYYLLKDGRAFVDWIRETTPLPADVQDDFYRELDAVMWAVLVGHVLIAIVQGVIAGLGLIATGVPNGVFWTFVMIVLALIPLVGAFLVWGPAVVYLALIGEPFLAAALFVYSAIVVSISDDYLRPIVVDRYAELSPAIIILGVLGGAYAFGIMGLFFGPVILGAFAATLTVLDEHYHRLEEEAKQASG